MCVSQSPAGHLEKQTHSKAFVTYNRMKKKTAYSGSESNPGSRFSLHCEFISANECDAGTVPASACCQRLRMFVHLRLSTKASSTIKLRSPSPSFTGRPSADICASVLLYERVMPRFSRFYSATEADAAARLVQLFPQRPEAAPKFSSDDAKHLTDLLDGTVTSQRYPRQDYNRPLFRPEPSVQSVEELLNASTFSVAQESVYRDKPVDCESTSDDSREWKTRSRTPSSVESSPQKHQLPSPTLSVKAEASSASDGSDDGLMHMIAPARQAHMNSWAVHTDHDATFPQNVLQTMDTQFSKWSYDLNEGRTAIPFVMAQAPTETHERLVGIDRKLWRNGGEDSSEDVAVTHGVAKEVLEHLQQKASQRADLNKVPRMAKHSSTSPAEAVLKHDSTSKRAALIAKSKAARDDLLVANKSAGQRRSALQKNRYRKSIMPSPPPTARRAEPTQRSKQQAEQSKPTIFILNPKDDDQRRNVDVALQNRSIDFEDSEQLKTLMQRLGSTENGNRPGTGHGRD